ncbi:RNA polymerase II transcription factor SIII subunit A-domain-containing protein [Lipomyces kononenkoae]
MSNTQHDAEEVDESTMTIDELSSEENEALLGIKPGHFERDGPMSLFQICLQTCMLHGNRIVDVGDIPYDIIKPVLSRMTPSQLIAIEQKSPHIIPESNELWEGFLRRSFSEEEIKDVTARKVRDVRKQYFMLLEARRLRLKKTSEKVKAQYEALEREKAQKRIVTLDIFEDPMEAQRRKKRLLQHSSAAALKKMSVVKRARMESMSNPIFSSDNIKITSTANNASGPMSHEEADRRRQEKLNQRIAERNHRLQSRDISSNLPVAVHTSPVSVNVRSKSEYKPSQTGLSAPKLSFFDSLSPRKTTPQIQSVNREARKVASPLIHSKKIDKKA